jgi:DNA-binding SARP family transcriptional activator
VYKPVTADKIINEMENLRHPVKWKDTGIFMNTFGNFELIVNGEEVSFGRAKSKEMLAYLEKVVTQDYEKLGAEYQEMLASTATSLADLDKLSTTDNFDPEARQKALTSLASAYEDCRGEVDAYKKALASGNPQ